MGIRVQLFSGALTAMEGCGILLAKFQALPILCLQWTNARPRFRSKLLSFGRQLAVCEDAIHRIKVANNLERENNSN